MKQVQEPYNDTFRELSTRGVFRQISIFTLKIVMCWNGQLHPGLIEAYEGREALNPFMMGLDEMGFIDYGGKDCPKTPEGWLSLALKHLKHAIGPNKTTDDPMDLTLAHLFLTLTAETGEEAKRHFFDALATLQTLIERGRPCH